MRAQNLFISMVIDPLRKFFRRLTSSGRDKPQSSKDELDFNPGPQSEGVESLPGDDESTRFIKLWQSDEQVSSYGRSR